MAQGQRRHHMVKRPPYSDYPPLARLAIGAISVFSSRAAPHCFLKAVNQICESLLHVGSRALAAALAAVLATEPSHWAVGRYVGNMYLVRKLLSVVSTILKPTSTVPSELQLDIKSALPRTPFITAEFCFI